METESKNGKFRSIIREENAMEALKQEVHEIKQIERNIADKLSNFGGTVIQLAQSVAKLEIQISHLRKDLDKTDRFENRISDLEKQLAKQSGSWVTIGSMIMGTIALAGVVVEAIKK